MAILTLYAFVATVAAHGCEHAMRGSRPESAATTPPPSAKDLRKRQSSVSVSSSESASSSSIPIAPSQVCGYHPGETNSVWCNPGFHCAASIFPNGDAYQYCGQRGAADPEVYTTGVNNANANKECPSGVFCCYSPTSILYTYHITASGFQVTAFGCATESIGTVTILADTNVINPSFSASLRTATASSSTPPGPPPPDGNGSGLSSGAKIGIGAGAGGVGVLLIAGLACFCLRSRKKKKDRRLAEIQPTQAGYSQPMSNIHGQPQYNQQQGASPPWSPQPPASPYPQYSQQPVYPLEPHKATYAYEKSAAGESPKELHGQHVLRDYWDGR